jgi:hypothetical protein
MPLAGLEPAIPASEPPQTHALNMNTSVIIRKKYSVTPETQISQLQWSMSMTCCSNKNITMQSEAAIHF